MAATEPRRIGVLFMQSQEFFGADSQIHASIMRHLDRDRFDVHCAVAHERGGNTVASVRALSEIPDVRLRATDFGPSLEAESKRRKLVVLASRVPGMLWSLAGLVAYVRRHRIDVVHCTEKPRDAVLGQLVARASGAKCVIHVHVKAESWLQPKVQGAMRRSDALIGVSDFVSETIRTLLGPECPPVHTVLNALELDEWVRPEVEPGTMRDRLGVGPDTPLIVSASRLFRHKGQHELLAALPAVRERFPDVRVLIVGADDERSSPGEGSYSDLLRSMCEDLDIVEHVVFTGWRSDVRELMAASDVYAMPSFEEPFGMVFIEAMYLGRPVVALDNGGTREVVDHEGSGLLSDPGDTDALADNLVRLLADPELRRRMGQHGHERVATRFDASRMARDTERVYEAVLEAR